MTSKPEWYNLQEEVCEHFRSIGAEAESNKTIQGVRTKHDIDVYVSTKFLGEDLTWIVEVKHWKEKISKLHVLALRAISEEIGADRAFIIAESGFQKGAVEATEKTNVKLKTFTELKATTKDLIESKVLDLYKRRIALLEARYWAHSKSIRKKYGLRGEITDFPIDFSGGILVSIIESAMRDAEKREYPIYFCNPLRKQVGDPKAENFQQLTNWLNLNLNMLDGELLKAEHEMILNGEFNPEYEHRLKELGLKC